MKRILRIINRFNLGGPVYNAAYLTKYLYPEYETLLIGGIQEDDEESAEFILNSLGIKAVVIPEMHRSINGINDFIAYKKIKKIIKDFKPHIVHTHASKAGMLGRKAAYDLNVPVIVHTFHGHVFHSYFNSIKTKAFIEIERKLAKITDKIIAISPSQKKELIELYKIANADKFEVIPLGLDLQRFKENKEEKRYIFRKQHNIESNEIIVVTVGRLAPIKNHKLFIKAVAKAKEVTHCKIRAFIVGDGDIKKDLEKIAQDLNLKISSNEANNYNSDIHFLGWVKDVDYVYSGADIVALTSLNEGTPVSLIEAQANGKPIVSTNVGGIEDIVLPGVSALLSPSNSEDIFIENFIRLIKDKQLRTEMSNKAEKYVFDKFNINRLVNDMKSLYDKLLQQKNVFTGFAKVV